jgi:hypothetical protein
MRSAGRRGGLAAFALAAVCVPAAAAAGGTSIAAAPFAQAGVGQSSDSATDATVVGSRGSQVTGCWLDFEYWRLRLEAGSRIAISGTEGPSASNYEIGAFPPGTTDASIGSTAALASGLPDGGRVLRFTAPTSGAYVLVAGPNCYNGMNGPFSFVVTVTAGSSPPAAAQRPLLVLTPISRLARQGVVVASVHGAGGTAISDTHLVLSLDATWSGHGAPTVIATATASGGEARFRFLLPATLTASSVRLRVVSAASPGYLASASASLVVALAPS